MTLWIGLRNLRVRAVATVLTVLVVAVATAIALVVPITLLNHHFRRHPDEYMQRQFYLNPHPPELMLRNLI